MKKDEFYLNYRFRVSLEFQQEVETLNVVNEFFFFRENSLNGKFKSAKGRVT